MLVLCALINIKIVQKPAAKWTFGEHAFHGMTQDAVCAVFLQTQLGGGVKSLTTRISSITCVKLVGLFVASGS